MSTTTDNTILAENATCQGDNIDNDSAAAAAAFFGSVNSELGICTDKTTCNKPDSAVRMDI